MAAGEVVTFGRERGDDLLVEVALEAFLGALLTAEVRELLVERDVLGVGLDEVLAPSGELAPVTLAGGLVHLSLDAVLQRLLVLALAITFLGEAHDLVLGLLDLGDG